MATSSHSCDFCDLRHITKPSIVWCTECDEGLCSECNEHHSLSKASRTHNAIPIAEFHKLPADLLKNTQYCPKHNKKHLFYCKKDKCPYCSTCIVECHKDCRDIVELDDIIHNAKTSNALFEIEETLVEVAENLQKISKHQQSNLSTLKEKRKEIEKEIKETRMKINNHLDKLQEDLIKQLYVLEEQEDSKICQSLSLLEKKEKEIAEYQTSILNIKQHATDLQMFLSMKQIEEEANSKHTVMQSLVENQGQPTLSYTINTSIQNIISQIKSFGEVHIESKSLNMVLKKKKSKQAQLIVPAVQPRSIEDIKLTIHETINTQEKTIFGCCILPDGRFAFTDRKNVKVFTNKGLKDFEVLVPGSAFDVVYISKDNALAVTSGNLAKCIYIVDLKGKKIKKTISLDSNIFGISLRDNQLIYSGKDKGLRMINMYDEFIYDIVLDEMPINCYTATFRDNLYHTNYETSTVACYDLQGKLQWTFHNESVLKNPHGIDVDTDGNVYVVGFRSHNVIVISSDGQQHREVLTKDDGLNDPISLHYSGPKKQLLVANYSSKAFLFNCI